MFTEQAHTLTRDPAFGGDLFVVGESADGTRGEVGVTLTLGHIDSAVMNLLAVDGNWDNMTVRVTGSAIFVVKASCADLYENVTVSNHRKVDCLFTTDIRSENATHVALVVDGLAANLYVNGVFAESLTLTAALPQVTEGFRIGADNRVDNAQYFRGTIYTVHMFGDARTAQEVAVDAALVTEKEPDLLYAGNFLQ